MKVLVTGGSGFLGKRLREKKPSWVYVSSKDYNLENYDECISLLESTQPDAIVHLAARVGGIKENWENPADFYECNVSINTNVLKAARVCGVKRVLSSLSTCAFPDVVKTYPFCEFDILEGPPAITNRPYGFSKRALYIQTLAYRQQYNLNYTCFCPSNLYGPGDNYDLDSSHFVAAMVRKLQEAWNGDTVEVWGTGRPLRQQMYIDDLATIIPSLLESHNTGTPLIVAPSENLSIKALVDLCVSVSGKDVKIRYTGDLDGQIRKDGSNRLFLETFPEAKFTSFREGVKKTYEWYDEVVTKSSSNISK